MSSIMTADQLRAARALLRITITDLAEATGVDKMAIVRFEAGGRPFPKTKQRLRDELEKRGIVFIGSIEPLTEPTVALRFGMAAPSAETDDGEQEETATSEKPFKSMAAYWADTKKWERLSRQGRKTISYVISHRCDQ